MTRKCIYGWANGSYNFRTKWSAQQIEDISNRLVSCNAFKPIELHRAIRPLKVLKFWKGLEYRTFLLYLSPVILKDFLSETVYKHFLIFFCAVTIVSCEEYLKFIDIAETLFQDYINNFINIYGRDAISINVHNLCHVVSDVRKFGPLPDISAYQFENFLGKLKNFLRGGHRPLAQIAKRIAEFSILNTDDDNKYSSQETQFISNKKIQITNGFSLSVGSKNKWFMTKGKEIVAMVNASKNENIITINGIAIKEKHDFFESPVKSSRINIYASNGKTSEPKSYSLNNIKCKLFCLEYKSELVFFPLLHTLDEINNINQ